MPYYYLRQQRDYTLMVTASTVQEALEKAADIPLDRWVLDLKDIYVEDETANQQHDPVQFCPTCDGQTYLGDIGSGQEHTCPTCQGRGLIPW